MTDTAEFNEKITKYENDITELRTKLNGLVGGCGSYETSEVIQIGMAMHQSVEAIEELKNQFAYMQAGVIRPKMEKLQHTLGELLLHLDGRRIEDVFKDSGTKEDVDEEVEDLQLTLDKMLTVAT